MPPVVGENGAAIVASAVAAALDAAAAVAGERVIYRRGNADVEIGATRGRRSSIAGGEESVDLATLQEWINVDPGELRIDGNDIVPERNDLIVTAAGETFAVVYADDENCWRYMDQTHQRLRIHTIERGPTGEDGG